MQYTYATSAYHEARFLVHFHLAIRVNFEQGVVQLFYKYLTTHDMLVVQSEWFFAAN